MKSDPGNSRPSNRPVERHAPGRPQKATGTRTAGLPDDAAIFLAKVSHELRTPLTAIAGFAELLKAERSGPLGSPKYLDYAEHIIASAAHALSLLDDLLDADQVRAGQFAQHFEPLDLTQAADEAMATLQPLAARASVILQGEYASPVPQVFADIRAMRQILLNLLTNAIRYSPEGGSVIIDLARFEDVNGGGVRLTVSDDGEGFDTAMLQALAQPLDQAALDQSLATGHGLGLRLARSLAEANGAKFVISSGLADGKGTRVSLCFPMEKIIPER